MALLIFHQKLLIQQLISGILIGMEISFLQQCMIIIFKEILLLKNAENFMQQIFLWDISISRHNKMMRMNKKDISKNYKNILLHIGWNSLYLVIWMPKLV